MIFVAILTIICGIILWSYIRTRLYFGGNLWKTRSGVIMIILSEPANHTTYYIRYKKYNGG